MSFSKESIVLKLASFKIIYCLYPLLRRLYMMAYSSTEMIFLSARANIFFTKEKEIVKMSNYRIFSHIMSCVCTDCKGYFNTLNVSSVQYVHEEHAQHCKLLCVLFLIHFGIFVPLPLLPLSTLSFILDEFRLIKYRING